MQLELNGRTYLLALLVAIGLFLEALKLFSSAVSAPLHDGVGILSTRPYAISEKSIHQIQRAIERPFIPAIKTPPSVPAFDMKAAMDKWQKEQDKQKEAAKKLKAEQKKWHWVWNKKLGQWEWKKKTKKKKQADVQSTDANQTTMSSETVSAKSSDNSNLNTGAGGMIGSKAAPTTGPLGAAGGASTPQKFMTMQEWEDLLLGTPNQVETQSFVDAFKQHIVSDQMFYQIVDMMLKDNRPAMQEQGIYALGMTPSVESFVALATESQTLQTSSPAAQSATQYLAQYAQMENLSILQQVMTPAQTPQVLTVALGELQTAMQTNLHPTGPNPTAQGGPNAAAFRGFVPALTSLASSANAQIASQASNLLHQLQQSLGPAA